MSGVAGEEPSFDIRGPPANSLGYYLFCLASPRRGRGETELTDTWRSRVEVDTFCGRFCEMPTEPYLITRSLGTAMAPFSPLTSADILNVRTFMNDEQRPTHLSIYPSLA
eukprot:GHVU01173280.1.p4 GENE.GHVU01173280.1~~GHVU01173280.1.p4  ORF type:complete len:110 (+),score=11.91 GHVU01173280.1:1903-2232(+)